MEYKFFMQDNHSHFPNNSAPVSPAQFLRMSTISYFVMAFIGLEISWWWHHNTKALFLTPAHNFEKAIAIIFCAVCFLVIAQKGLEIWVPSYRQFLNSLAKLLGQFSILECIWLAFCSSMGEEILFRSAIQPFLGIWITSFLFGALHLDEEGRITVWTIWAIIAGLILGSTMVVTGSIWPPVIIHFLVNLIGIRNLTKKFMSNKKVRG
jgi:membrane protease YdiL (CAAX protease family)